MIPEDDRGLLLGDGLFETILALDGRLQHFDAHIERMIRGCAVIGLEPPDPRAARRAAEAAAHPLAGRAVVRITHTAGSGRGLERPEGSAPRQIVTAGPAPAWTGAVRLALSSIRRNPTSPASRLKSLAYLDNVMARRQAREAGADEALMLSTGGLVACAAAANLFWIMGDRLFTPALACGVLDGIARGRVLEAAASMGVETVQVEALADVLESAQAAFLTNSLIGVRPVSEIDGRPIGPHALTDALSNRCR